MFELKKFLSYLLAETWLIENKVRKEYREELLPIVEKVYDFFQEYGRVRGKIKLGLGDLEEINKLRKEFQEYYQVVMSEKTFRKDPYLSKILEKLFEEAKKVLDQPLVS